jgi:acetyl esterase/lipase
MPASVAQRAKTALLAAALLSAVVVVRAQHDKFACPLSSCWCRDSFATADIAVNRAVYYRTAFNKVTQQNQTLFLDEYLAGGAGARPGAIIIHGGGFSAGTHNGCSHARDMLSFVDVAQSLARRGFSVVSIDYRCEGALRDTPRNESTWLDPVEDARAAVRFMVQHAARLQLDTGRIVAFGGSAGACTVANTLFAPFNTDPAEPDAGGNVTCGIALSGSVIQSARILHQVEASAASPPYLDLHGTNDSTVPYSNNYLCAIPGAGHVPCPVPRPQPVTL